MRPAGKLAAARARDLGASDGGAGATALAEDPAAAPSSDASSMRPLSTLSTSRARRVYSSRAASGSHQSYDFQDFRRCAFMHVTGCHPQLHSAGAPHRAFYHSRTFLQPFPQRLTTLGVRCGWHLFSFGLPRPRMPASWLPLHSCIASLGHPRPRGCLPSTRGRLSAPSRAPCSRPGTRCRCPCAGLPF